MRMAESLCFTTCMNMRLGELTPLVVKTLCLQLAVLSARDPWTVDSGQLRSRWNNIILRYTLRNNTDLVV